MTTTDPKTAAGPDDHGFTIRRTRWPWAVARWPSPWASPPPSPSTPSRRQVAEQHRGRNPGRRHGRGQRRRAGASSNFVAEDVAPQYGIKVAFKGLSDQHDQPSRATGEVAGTIYQHKLWLSQVLEANPDFKRDAATPVFRWGFGIWSQKYTVRR